MHSKLRLYKRSRTEIDLADFKSNRNQYFKAINEAKKSHWEAFLQNTPDVYKAYRYIRNKRGDQLKVPNIKYKREGVETVAKSA